MRKKTAEERFHTLARGWLAYPVTSIHSHLPPKSGCICQHIPRFALSRRRATALFRNPVCKAQRSVPGFSSTPNSACRRYATSPPSAVASPHRPPSPQKTPVNGAIHRHRKNRRRAVSYVSTGLARLPRDANASPIYRRRAVVENTPEGGIVRHRTLRSVFLNEAASPQPILAYLSNIVLPTYHQ